MHSLNFTPGSGNFWNAYQKGLADLSRPFDQVERNCDFDLKLLTLRMMPLFAKSPPPGTILGWVSGLETINKLRDITKSIDMMRSRPVTDNEEMRLAMSCANGVASQLHIHHITSHVASLSDDENVTQDDEWHTTWCGLYITTSIYFHRVLGLRDPSERTYQTYVIHVLKKAITKHLARMKSGQCNSEKILLWQILLGAINVEMILRDEVSEDHDPPTTVFFDMALWDWSQAVGVEDWSEARDILSEIVWPSLYPEEALLEEIWIRSRVYLRHVMAQNTS
jgi:hypothetical protein